MNTTLANAVWSWIYIATALAFLSVLGLDSLNAGPRYSPAKAASKPGKIIFAPSDSETRFTAPAKQKAATPVSVSNPKIVTTAEALTIIRKREGLALEAHKEAVIDQWLIGYGHAGGVDPGDTITKHDAERLLLKDVAYIEDYIAARVRVPVNANEMSAMVLLAYNIGNTAFGGSTVLRELNAGNREAAADGFLLWNKITVDGNIEENARQTKYRRIERDLFLSQPD